MNTPLAHYWLPIDKPAGYTSHDIVAIARKKLGTRKIGHTGTLDPDATGVLVLAVGKAPRLIQYLQGQKQYWGRVRLGQSTDTLDASGNIVSERDVPDLKRSDVEKVLMGFQGPISQIPPMYSAVSVKGKRLHQLARKGQEIERPSRQVEIHELQLKELSLPHFDLLVTCSAGTYIRTLAHDIGEQLGCGAHLAQLVRTRAHVFSQEEALSLDDLSDPQKVASAQKSPDFPLEHLPQIELTPENQTRFFHGQRLMDNAHSEGLYRIYGPAQDFCGLARVEEALIQPVLVFHP